MYEDDKLKDLVYEFFFKFSRLEFALKEAGFRYLGRGRSAQPDWNAFIQRFEAGYIPCAAAQKLFGDPPKYQTLDSKQGLCWKRFEFEKNTSDLRKVTLVIRAVRNNLFHGGKHGEKSWDDPARVQFLLQNSLSAIASVAELDGDIRAHYLDKY